MSDEVERDGWKEWSKHIINALERLDKQLDTLRNDLNKVNLDIAKLSYLNLSLADIENKLLRIREDVVNHQGDFKDALNSLERDGEEKLKKLESDILELRSQVAELQTFMTRTKTIAWVIGSILAAILGMLSINLKELFK